MLVILDGFTTFFGTRQKYQESLQDYTRIFKTSYEVLQSHIGGPIQLQKILNTLNGFTDDPDSKDELLMNKQLKNKQSSSLPASYTYKIRISRNTVPYLNF